MPTEPSRCDSSVARFMVCRLARPALAAWFSLAPFAIAADPPQQVLSITSRPGVTQAFILLTPANPIASAILLPGGDGDIGLSEEGAKKPNNFLVRSRRLFAAEGLMIAVLDASSDFKSRTHVLDGHRQGEAHAQDIKAVIDYLRGKAPVPVWVIGTSRGTISAANAAARLGRGVVDGLVLTASVTQTGRKRSDTVFDAKLREIDVPVLLVHHERDQCEATPANGMENIKEKLKNASKVEIMSFSGGEEPRAKPCQALTYHGFLGIESEVVGKIAAWIKAQNR